MMNNNNIPNLQIPAAQIQPNNNQQPQPLNLSMNIPALNPPQHLQYAYPIMLNPQQLLLHLQQLQQLQFQQVQFQQVLSNQPASILVLQQPYNQVMIPNQNINYNYTPMTMQNSPTTVYKPSAVNNINMSTNTNMNMNINQLSNSNISNMSGTTLSSPPSTSNNITAIQHPQQHPQQHEPANSRNNMPRLSPRLSPKLLSISEEKTFDDNECMSNEQYLNVSAPVFTPSPPSSPSLTPEMPQYSAKKIEEYVPKYPARAQLNIFIHKNLTKELVDEIYEQFPNPERLYYYLDISTALQINDKQMNIFEYEDNNGQQVQIILVNYDLHCKQRGDITLYGLITANTGHNIKQNKWMWKLDKFMTAIQIESMFGIKANDLPKSSRLTLRFQKELGLQSQCIMNMSLDIIDSTDWFNIQQIKSLRRDNKKNKKYLQIVAKINESRWIEQCKKVWHKAPAIPIVVKNKNGENKHWIEWVKLIMIEEEDNNGNKLTVGVSCKYSDDNKWEIKSICLDRGDIENKHRLVGLSEDDKARYLANFYNFHTTIAEIQWIRSN